ncbi:hypothetical protein RJ639_018921 [Escallonia herrerae]|uniref:Enoyl reductase (ER) domain-containing protein n=1 Tax=Escallonia herrerae TaxID=1293975 RepID=A0AA88VD23_9ASTE|nr:hypothetical protein RJ639_018921 [Escallonia herrerae]
MTRKTCPEDVVLRVLFCGIDHTDLHQMRSEIHTTSYPLVPACVYVSYDDQIANTQWHEVVGEVVELGSNASKFAVGDTVGVGCIVGSCGECSSCKSSIENYCSNRIFTYNDIYKDGRPTQGGFSSAMVVHQKIPEKLAPEQAAPLLCAGVTAYSPLKQFIGSETALKAGTLGLGGVGHLEAMGHHVTVISSSEEALKHLGADAFLVSSNPAETEGASNSIDYILDTVPAGHPLQAYVSVLKIEGKIFILGAAPKPLEFDANDMILGKKTITGSFIGSMHKTEEILEFWEEKGLKTMIEVVKMDYVNKAFERMERNDVRYRFVLDVAGSNLD